MVNPQIAQMIPTTKTPRTLFLARENRPTRKDAAAFRLPAGGCSLMLDGRRAPWCLRVLVVG
jgi:hypothetical protein